MSGRWFPWHPKGVCTLSIHPKVFFSDLMARASRLNSLHGLKILFTIIQTIKKVLRHYQHLLRIYGVINVGILSNFAVFGHQKCHKVRRNFRFLQNMCFDRIYQSAKL